MASISGKGWVVIPKRLRERYGFKKGDQVHFVDYGGVLAIVPKAKDSIHKAHGMLKGGRSLTEALLEARRKDLARE
jgi:AbrB family looped-hinge helix DNA binding protein